MIEEPESGHCHYVCTLCSHLPPPFIFSEPPPKKLILGGIDFMWRNWRLQNCHRHMLCAKEGHSYWSTHFQHAINMAAVCRGWKVESCFNWFSPKKSVRKYGLGSVLFLCVLFELRFSSLTSSMFFSLFFRILHQQYSATYTVKRPYFDTLFSENSVFLLNILW